MSADRCRQIERERECVCVCMQTDRERGSICREIESVSAD